MSLLSLLQVEKLRRQPDTPVSVTPYKRMRNMGITKPWIFFFVRPANIIFKYHLFSINICSLNCLINPTVLLWEYVASLKQYATHFPVHMFSQSGTVLWKGVTDVSAFC